MKVRFWLLLVLALGVLSFEWWTWREADQPIPSPPSAEKPIAAAPKPTAAKVAPPVHARPADATAAVDGAYETLAQLAGYETEPYFVLLREDLASYPREQAVAAIRQFLQSNRNRSTQLTFRLGADGKLESAPTLRVWLLDELARIDLTAAAAEAESILGSRGNANEWALALRDYARANTNPDAAAFLRGKLREMWSEPRWIQERSEGWLQSFELPAYLHAADFARDLAHLMTESQGAARPAARAATTALERLIIVEPAAVLEQLQRNPDWLRGMELERANYFSRADVRDPAQRASVEAYLLDAARDASELEKFFMLFPNRSQTNAGTLITRLQPALPEEIRAAGLEALKTLETWQSDPRFAPLAPRLQATRERLGQSASSSTVR
jgi:hypothetical protein